MAERLTKKDKPILKNQMEDNMSVNKNTAIKRLWQYENVMEKYGIESVEELDKKIGYYIDKIDLEAENDYLKKAIEKQNVVTQSISKDRDTWQKACELMGKTIQNVYPEPFYRFTEDIPNYFYQQAKKEGNDE